MLPCEINFSIRYIFMIVMDIGTRSRLCHLLAYPSKSGAMNYSITLGYLLIVCFLRYELMENAVA